MTLLSTAQFDLGDSPAVEGPDQIESDDELNEFVLSQGGGDEEFTQEADVVEGRSGGNQKAAQEKGSWRGGGDDKSEGLAQTESDDQLIEFVENGTPAKFVENEVENRVLGGDKVDVAGALLAQDSHVVNGRTVATKRGCVESKKGAQDQGSRTDGGPAETVAEGARPVKLARLFQDPQEYAKSMQSKNTKSSTQYACDTYNKTMKSVSALLKQKHYELHDVPVDELPARLGKFFMSVQKKSGGSMNASSLGTIYQSLVRYLLEEHPLKVDIRADQRFSVVLKNLKAAQKESCMDGEVPGKNKMEPLQEHHIAKCWAEGSFGRDNPTQLVRTAHMIIVSNVGFRANEECHNLLNEDLVMSKKSTHGVPDEVTVSERVTKTRQGQKNQARDRRPVMYADHENPGICPVRTLMAYQERKTEAQRDGKQRFFLNVKQSAVRDPKKEEKWYATSPMSSKEIAKLLPNALKDIGIDTKAERLGNTSLRKSMVETLVKAQVPTVVIREKAGHESEKSMSSYAQGGSTAHKASSLIMSRTMGGKKAEKFGNTVEEVEAAEEVNEVAQTSRTSPNLVPLVTANQRVGDRDQKRGSEKEESTAQSLVPSTPTPQMLAQSPAAPTPQMPLLPGIPPFGFPAVTFQQQYFHQQMLMAQQLGLASNPMLMMAPQAPQFFQQQQLVNPHPTAFGVSSPPLSLLPNHQVGPSLTLADLKQQQQDELDRQRKILEAEFDAKLEARDQHLATKLESIIAKEKEEDVHREELR